MVGGRAWYRVAQRWGIRFLTILGSAVVLATITPIDCWWAKILAGHAYYSTGDVLIVLSGSMFQDGTMGWNSYLRTLYAGRGYRAGGFKQVVVTGGPSPFSQTPVALAMSEFLKCQGIPPEEIRVETASGSTRENALFTKPILDSLSGRHVLLTSDYHMFRARRVFAGLGVEVLPYPIPDVGKRGSTWAGRWPAFLDLVVETCKIAYYWLRGWI